MLNQDSGYLSTQIRAQVGELLIARRTLTNLLANLETAEKAGRLLPQQDYYESQLDNIEYIKEKFDNGTWTISDAAIAGTFLTGVVYHVAQVKELAGTVPPVTDWLLYAGIGVGIFIIYRVFIK